MTKGNASITWEAEIVETTTIGSRWVSHAPTGRTKETSEGDPEQIEKLRRLLKDSDGKRVAEERPHHACDRSSTDDIP